MVFPAELWNEIFRFLNNTDLKSFAITSHRARALVASRLFATINIRFGRIADFSTFNEETGLPNWDEEREEAANGRALEVLLRLAKPEANDIELSLSNLVQALHVVVTNTQHPLVFEKYYLRLALKRLNNLRRFSWIGGRLPLDIAEELRASCPNLQSLYVHGIESESATPLMSVCNFRSIELIDICASSVSHPGVSDGSPVLALEDILDRNHGSLKKMALSGYTLQCTRNKMLKVVSGLTELAVNAVQHLPDLSMILQEASALESLALLDVTSLACLPNSEGSLPRLRDLRLGIDHLRSPEPEGPFGFGADQIDMCVLAKLLLAFVRRHRDLRRFDFSLWPTRTVSMADDGVEVNALWFLDVMKAVNTLHGVQALGLSFPAMSENDMQGALLRLAMFTPSMQTCTALRLGGISNARVETVVGYLRRWTFLAISNARPKESVIPIYPIPSIEKLIFNEGLYGMKQVCICGKMFDIVLLSLDADEVHIQTERWTSERLRKRTEADFCSLDAYWLMSYRTISEEYERADLTDETDGMVGVEIDWEL